MLTVMVVDDDYLVLKGIKKTIKWQENGFEIVGEALNCEEAIDVFKEKNPDIIITDIRMGEGNGLDLVAEIKELKPDVEFVIISGYEQFD
ncbi:MAG: response regulator, partial [Oscillospiraceae bacterium]